MGQGTIISGRSNGGGAGGLSSLMGMIKQFSGGSGTAGDVSGGSIPDGYNAANPSKSEMPTIDAPQIGDSAMSRRADTNMNSPQALLAQGITHVDDPNVPLDYETRMAIAEPLLRAQHFGYGGGLDTGSQSEGQGKVKEGKLADNGGLSKVLSVVGMLV